MGANWVASIESPKHRRRRRSLWLGSSWISREQSTSAAPCPREQVAKDPKTHLSIYTNLLTNSCFRIVVRMRQYALIPLSVRKVPEIVLMILGPLILLPPGFRLLLQLSILGFLESYGLVHQAIEQVCGQLFALCFLY